MPENEFYQGPDWEGSSGPIISRNVQSDDLYPHSVNCVGKDVLADGLHPCLAIGAQAAGDGRGIDQKCGVLITYNANVLRGVLNVAEGFVFRQYVANILTYAAGVPATWAATLNIGEPVYVDDTPVAAGLAAGVTLTMSPMNNAGLANPLAGWMFYDQTEDEDVGVGGGNVDAWPKTGNVAATVYTLVNVMLR